MIRLGKLTSLALPFAFVGVPAGIHGQTDALALAVVAWLTAYANSYVLPINPQRRFRLIDDLAKIPAFNQPASVDVFPADEISNRADRGKSMKTFESLYAIHILIQQQVSGAVNEDDQCAMLTTLRSQIIERLKLRMFNLPNAVHPVSGVFLAHLKSADRGLYDLMRLTNDHVYFSDTILTFKASV